MLFIILSGLNTNNKIHLHNPSNIFLSLSLSMELPLLIISSKNDFGKADSAWGSFKNLFHSDSLEEISFNKEVNGSFLFNSDICFL